VRTGVRPAAGPDRDRDAAAAAAVEGAYREHWARLVALLATHSRRLDLAEDSVQEAFIAAAATWPAAGVPTNPAAWLLTAARRRLIDRARAETAEERRLPRLVVGDKGGDEFAEVDAALEHADEATIADERLRLLFVSCHPALAPETRVALMLRFVGGLTVPEIARLLLVPEATMAARITRAKKKIATAGIPFRVPPPDRLGARLSGVLVALYLMFTEGYAATAGEALIRTDLAAEAIRLTRSVDELVPREPRIRALLALMLLQHARRDARFSGTGDIVLLPDQDRARWHRDEIAEGLAMLDALDPAAPVDQYLLQARIAAEHARATTAAATDWFAITGCYAELERVTGSPVVRLNRAVAAAEAAGPLAGLALLDGLDAQLPRSHQLPAVRAELLLRLGDPAAAAAWFDRALELVRTDPERRHLQRRRAACA
jgi:RNA polymerase sigma-70 factor (ECF subfamily)